jgi:hypothetical protein
MPQYDVIVWLFHSRSQSLVDGTDAFVGWNRVVAMRRVGGVVHFESRSRGHAEIVPSSVAEINEAGVLFTRNPLWSSLNAMPVGLAGPVPPAEGAIVTRSGTAVVVSVAESTE